MTQFFFMPTFMTDSMFSGSGINFSFNANAGNGQIAARTQANSVVNNDRSVSNRWLEAQGFSPFGSDSSSALNWLSRDTAQTDDLAVFSNNGVNLGNRGGHVRTQALQTAMDTPEAQAVSSWIVNDLEPSTNGTASANVTQVLDVANPDGSTTRVGRNRDITFQGRPVVNTPSNVTWSSSRFTLNMNNNNEASLSYNRQNSSGETTDVSSRVVNNNGTFVNDTTGTRTSPNSLSTLDGLSAYQPSESNTQNTGFGNWFSQQLGHIWSWINTGNLQQVTG